MPLEEQLKKYKRLILNIRVFDCKLDIDFH